MRHGQSSPRTTPVAAMKRHQPPKARTRDPARFDASLLFAIWLLITFPSNCCVVVSNSVNPQTSLVVDHFGNQAMVVCVLCEHVQPALNGGLRMTPPAPIAVT